MAFSISTKVAGSDGSALLDHGNAQQCHRPQSRAERPSHCVAYQDSRSEGRRLLDGLDEFAEIDVDFAGVQALGQGFVDELLRVWPHEYPGRTINPINMNEARRASINRSADTLELTGIQSSRSHTAPEVDRMSPIQWTSRPTCCHNAV